MVQLSKKIWSRINDFLLVIPTCSLKGFHSKILDELPQLIPFGSSGCITEVNINKWPLIVQSIQMDKKWNNCFNAYFNRVGTQPPYSPKTYSATFSDLKKINPAEYVTDFLMPQHVDHCIGITIYDCKDVPKYTYTFNRTKSEIKFDSEDMTVLNIIQFHINNYYKLLTMIERLRKLPVMSIELEKNTRLLSQRESEIVSLLLKRLNPADIARDLGISILTVKKHIQNIYHKLDVRDRQQLFEKIKSDIKIKEM